MIGVLEIRARRAAGETLRYRKPLRSLCATCGGTIRQIQGKGRPRIYCSEECKPHITSWGFRERPSVTDTDRSYTVLKTIMGCCSTDYSIVPISLSRNATYFEAA